MTQDELNIITLSVPLMQACQTYANIDITTMFRRIPPDQWPRHACELFDRLTDEEQDAVHMAFVSASAGERYAGA